MATYTDTAGVAGILPGDYADLIVGPVSRAAVALDERVSTMHTTVARTMHVPVVDSDAAASWVAEGAEIAPTDPTLHELTITPAKVAALNVVSSELAHDSSPAAAEIVGDGLARSIAAKLDDAYFGALASPAPSGLGGLDETTSGIIVIDESSAALGNLDPFALAISDIQQAGSTATAFVANPVDALTIQTLKRQSGSNEPLLGTDASNGTARQVFGVPLLVSRHVAQGTVWALAATRNLVVIREDVEVHSDTSPYFTSDRVAIRGIMRVGFGYPTPAAIVKIKLQATS
jgi:HK97 family phage major capsid protein